MMTLPKVRCQGIKLLSLFWQASREACKKIPEAFVFLSGQLHGQDMLGRIHIQKNIVGKVEFIRFMQLFTL